MMKKVLLILMFVLSTSCTLYRPNTADHDIYIPEKTPSHKLKLNDQEIPKGFTFIDVIEYSNREFADTYEEGKSTIFDNLEIFGRITGYYSNYFKNEFLETCYSENGLTSFHTSISFYETSSGAEESLNWFFRRNSKNEEKIVSHEVTDRVGQNAYYDVVEMNSVTCGDKVLDIEGVEISFQRHNVYGTVQVFGIRDINTYEKLEVLAYDIASILDDKIIKVASDLSSE